jgi:hypothetical protein
VATEQQARTALERWHMVQAELSDYEQAVIEPDDYFLAGYEAGYEAARAELRDNIVAVVRAATPAMSGLFSVLSSVLGVEPGDLGK